MRKQCDFCGQTFTGYSLEKRYSIRPNNTVALEIRHGSELCPGCLAALVGEIASMWQGDLLSQAAEKRVRWY